MDRKSLIIVAVSLLALFGLWTGTDHFFPPTPPLRQQVAATNHAATVAAQTAVAPATPAALSAMMPSGVAEQTLTVSNKDLLFHFTSYGGGLKLIELRDYHAAVKSRKKATVDDLASLNTRASVPILAVLGGEQIEGDNSYVLSQPNRDTVRAEKTLPSGARIVKEFQIDTNYLFTASVRIENTSDKPLTLPSHNVVVGTASAMVSNDDPTLIGAYWYNGLKLEDIKSPWFANRTLGCVPGTPRTEYREGANNVVWAAIHNQFFTLAAIPLLPTNAPQVFIHQVQLPPPVGGAVTNSLLTNGLQTAFTYPQSVLDPGKSIQQTYKIYAGPKEYNRLAQLGYKMGNNLDLVMGFSGFFGFFSKLLLLSMTLIANILKSIGIGSWAFGFAIIIVTVIIKTLFWPLTNASTKSMKRMQALQPQMKAIADKYKDDPAKKNQKTMEFMKEHKVNPLGGCLPVLLQIPVFIGFYWMLRSAIELRGVPFLWATDLSQMDTIFYIGDFPINPFPILMTITMIWQTGLTPASPGMDPTQQKMMRWGMPLMMLFFFYKMSAGLTLYWTVQNLLTIAQTKMTKMTDTGHGPKTGGLPVKKKK